MDRIVVSRKFYKNPSNTNPCLPNFFCADPAAVEYEGRLYVYGTNDNQQYLLEGDAGQNTYEKIKSIVCFSTDDMVNWTFHGVIDFSKVAPWTLTSWAPAIIFRKEDDGLTHFYMYFSNTGYGVGVITATNPLGPWTSPLDQSLIFTGMKGIKEVPNPFDPGACMDKEGNGWLVFGGGTVEGCTEDFPGSTRIVKLGKDLISLDSQFAKINAPYFFEASQLNYINDTFIYSFNSNWIERKLWNNSCEPSTQCSLNYMISKTPLDENSWEYKGNYFKNPGEQGLNYSNNHGTLKKYKNQYYLFYHTLILQEDMPVNGGFRSICVNKIDVNEETLEIKMCTGTRKGVTAIKNLDGFKTVPGSTICTCAEVGFDSENLDEEIGTKSLNAGAWYSVKSVDFKDGATGIEVLLTGTDSGYVEVRAGKVSGKTIATITKENQKVDFEESVKGVSDLYFVFSEPDMVLKYWKLY